jgi:hypothetical protein
MTDDRWFEALANATDFDARGVRRAPPSLKSRLYSALVREQSTGGPLLSLPEVKSNGRQLCVFEDLVAALPVSEATKARNPCRICHARVLGERLEHAPIFWPACPYSEFHNG